jgi:hypothetical protein
VYSLKFSCSYTDLFYFMSLLACINISHVKFYIVSSDICKQSFLCYNERDYSLLEKLENNLIVFIRPNLNNINGILLFLVYHTEKMTQIMT